MNLPIKLLLLSITPVTLLLAKIIGATAIFVILTQILAYLIVTKRKKWILLAMPVILGFGYLYKGENLISSSGRVSEWKLFMDWWLENSNRWIGTGSGTAQWLGPVIQAKTESLFVWFHNEYLQILFEQGIIGLGLAMALLVICIKKAWRRPWLLSTIGGIGFSFFTQFPLRFPISALFVLAIIRCALVEDEC
jgi:O-antigen ligase